MTSNTSFQKNYAAIWLIRAGKLWFIAATVGLYAFGLFVILYYATTAISNRFEIWNKNLYSGILPGDWLGNFFLVFHILLASVILFGGPLQFMPFIRNRYRRFHRYLGRIYLILCVLIGLTGVVMTIQGKSFGSKFLQTMNSLTAIYICWFAVMTIRYAIKRNIAIHRRWALRLFMVANGVWLFRVWTAAWKILNNGYFDSSPSEVIGVITYLIPLPLLLLELYFWAMKKKEAKMQWMTVIIITFFTLIMIVGIYGTIVNMWLGKVQRIF